MVASKRIILSTALLNIQQFLSLASSTFDMGTCLVCVEEGCTYCMGSKYFDSQGICTCDDISQEGFFGARGGGCSDYSFGGSPLDEKWDCRFQHSGGTLLIVILPVIAIVSIWACIFCGYHIIVHKRRRREMQTEELVTDEEQAHRVHFSFGRDSMFPITSPSTTTGTDVAMSDPAGTSTSHNDIGARS